MDKQKEILKLEKRLREIEPIINKSFKTEPELKKHVELNKSLYEEAKSIHNQIQQLEYELLSPKEKQKEDKKMKFLALKAKGEPFDLTEFDDLNDL